MSKKFANHCLDRLTFGATLADVSAFNSLGSTNDARLTAYVNQQLNWSSVDDTAFENLIAPLNYGTRSLTLKQMWEKHHVGNDNRDRPREEMERLCVARGIHSKRQLLEVMADFWHNHFSIDSGSYYAQSSFTSWDRDVIRPPVSGHPRRSGMSAGHMFGNFRKMLELSSQHIAMQYYLDNYINQVGGPNENYAREVMELHTLGSQNYLPLADPSSVNKTDIPLPWGSGGSDIMVPIADQYVDDDIYSAMRMLTGWKVKHSSSSDSSDNLDDAAPFFYEPWHDSHLKRILGYFWNDNVPAPEDILQFFDILAYHPGTAQHIAGKLCRRFIGPEPSQAIIDAVADTFYENRYASNQLELTYKTMLLSDEFKSTDSYGKVFKRPMDAIISALRVCGSDYCPGGDYQSRDWNVIYYSMYRCGEKPFNWSTPDGYPLEESHWQNSNSLIYLMRFMDWICDQDAYDSDAVVRIREITMNASVNALPDHSPNNLATFWLRRILGYVPDGGWPGTNMHTVIREFIRNNPNDPGSWPADAPFVEPYNIDDNDGPYYAFEGLRGAVKLILSSPAFLYR